MGMRTEVIRVDPLSPSSEVIARAAAILASGGLVVLPTETVYGLSAVADDAAAVSRIFEVKGRPSYNPLIVHVADVAAARALSARWPTAADALARSCWPGPLTVVVPRDPARVPAVVTGGGTTVAVRIPAHPVTLAVLRALGRPLAAPSANRYQELSPTTSEHVIRSLNGLVDLVLDAGPSAHGIESTVVDCSGPRLTVLRPGALPIARLREAAAGLPVDAEYDSSRDATENDDKPLPSPGLVRRHYAPRAHLRVVHEADLEEALRELGPGTAVVTHRENAAPIEGAAEMVRMPAQPSAYGAALYATLHRLDDSCVHAILVEAVPSGEDWSAVRDRLSRAGA